MRSARPASRATTPLAVAPRALDPERARPRLVAEGAIGRNVLRRLRERVDQHLAADAMRTRDATEQDAIFPCRCDHDDIRRADVSPRRRGIRRNFSASFQVATRASRRWR